MEFHSILSALTSLLSVPSIRSDGPRTFSPLELHFLALPRSTFCLILRLLAPFYSRRLIVTDLRYVPTVKSSISC
ncbi:hypothetical protein BKA83DRAFT_4326890 [Pisolithus microcarpus]|nr:hypothetical protein BKA83DRAFT_4326890 [Pisolithus microcarpus]